MGGRDGVTMNDGDESGFSRKETTLYMYGLKPFAWSFNILPTFYSLLSQSHFQLRALTSASRPSWTWSFCSLRLSIGREIWTGGLVVVLL